MVRRHAQYEMLSRPGAVLARHARTQEEEQQKHRTNELFYRYRLAPFCKVCNPLSLCCFYRPAKKEPSWPFNVSSDAVSPLTLHSVMKVIILRETHTANKAFCPRSANDILVCFASRHRSRCVNDFLRMSPRVLHFRDYRTHLFFPHHPTTPPPILLFGNHFGSVVIVFFVFCRWIIKKSPVRSHFSMRRRPFVHARDWRAV